MTNLSLDEVEFNVVSSVLQALRTTPSVQDYCVPVDEFQRILEVHKVLNGTKLSDYILLNCILDEDNCIVNFGRLADELQYGPTKVPATQNATMQSAEDSTLPKAVDANPPTNSGHEVKQVNTSQAPPVQTPRLQPIPAPIESVPKPKLSLDQFGSHADFSEPTAKLQTQNEQPSLTVNQPASTLAMARTRQLRSLFNDFDTGRLSITEFHKGVLSLGFNNTTALKSLIRHNAYDLTFATLVRTLTHSDNVTDMESKVAGDVKLKSPLSIFHEPMTPAAAARSRLQNKASNLESHDVVAWRSEKQHDLGSPRQPVGDLNNPKSAALQMRRQSYDPNFAFESEATRMMSPRSRTQRSFFELGRRPSDPPSTPLSTRDVVYKSIRHLDMGAINVIQFRRVLHDANIESPPELEKLLLRHEANGSANFHDFVKVLDPLLGPVEKVNHLPATEPDRKAELPAKELPMAQQSHGDFISWRNQPNHLEELESETAVRGRRHVETNRKKEFLRLGAVDMLSWDTESKVSERRNSVGKGAGDRMHNASNSFQWFQQGESMQQKATAPLPPSRYRRNNAPHAPPFGTELDVGTQQPANQSARTSSRWTPLPYGTELDE